MSQQPQNWSLTGNSTMDEPPRDLGKAERGPSRSLAPPRPSTELEQVATATSTSSAASSASSSSAVSGPVRREIGTGVGTRTITTGPSHHHLERNATALSRIHTQRSQHSGTVGGTLKSRDSRRPLPNFGGGKPYPPMLPEREEYVVEFDGEHDPRHAMNWSLRKKYVF